MAIPLGLTGATQTRAIIDAAKTAQATDTGNSTSPDTTSAKPKSGPATLTKELQLNMEQMRAKIGNLAQTNHYFVQIPIPPKIVDHLNKNYPGQNNESVLNFARNKLGFFCSEATLPVSSYATAEVKDNFMGVTQEFAHTRLYTDMDMTFYVDDNYDVLRFFEGWMDYISGAGDIPQSTGGKHYYRRFAFPDHYKVDNLSIIKFERDFGRKLIYNFINIFPKGLTAIPVSYGPADLLKVTVTFNFDRYVVSREVISTLSEKRAGTATREEFEANRRLFPYNSYEEYLKD
jgi:hypothetical protein